MAMIDAVKSDSPPPFRVAGVSRSEATPTVSSSREQALAQELDQRLSGQLDRIRARLAGDFSNEPAAQNPPGTGQRLDILA